MWDYSINHDIVIPINNQYSMESIRSGRFVFDRGSDENDLTRRLVRSSPTKGKGSVFFVKSRKSKLRVVYLG